METRVVHEPRCGFELTLSQPGIFAPRCVEVSGNEFIEGPLVSKSAANEPKCLCSCVVRCWCCRPGEKPTADKAEIALAREDRTV